MAYVNRFVLGRYWDAINVSFDTVWGDLAHFFPIETTACSICVSCFLGRTHSGQKRKAKLMQVSTICSIESCWNTVWQTQLNPLGVLCSVTYLPLSFKLPYSYAFRSAFAKSFSFSVLRPSSHEGTICVSFLLFVHFWNQHP